MTGYWPSSFYSVFMGRDGVKVHKVHAKKTKNKQGQHPAILTEQAWSIKDLSYSFRGIFFLREAAGSPERAR